MLSRASDSLGWSWGLQKSVSSGGKLGGKTELKTQVRGVLVRGTGEEKVVCLRKEGAVQTCPLVLEGKSLLVGQGRETARWPENSV